MIRSRKALLGALALAVVATLGLGGCAEPGVDGWHYIGPVAGTWAYGPRCTFKLENRPVANNGGWQVVVTDQSTGTVCGTELAQLKVNRVSCTYLNAAGFQFPEIPGDTCPKVGPNGAGDLWWPNQGYVQSPPIQS